MSDIINLPYGKIYEQKLLASIFKDRLFFIDIHEILKKDYFSDEYNKHIYDLTISYFYEYKDLPSLTYFKTEIENLKKESEDYKNKLVDALRHVILQKDETDLNYVKQSAKTFCQNQKMKEALYESVDLLEQSKFNEIFALMKDAVSSSVSKNVGHKYKENLISKYTESVRNTIEMPWEAMNEVLGGGIAAGELHIVAGLPGTGKSWMLVAMGAHAISQGFNVLHYSLELDENYVAFRYDANLTNISTDKLEYEDKDKLEKRINDKVSGNLIITSMESYNTTVDTLEMHIDKLQLVENFYPDLVIIDYPDLMVPSPRNRRKEGKEYQDIQDVYRELRGFGRRMNFPVLGVSQINKKGMEDDYIQEDKLASSFGKLMEADFLLSFSRKMEDQLAKTARFMILKNRFGPDKLKFTGNFDPFTGNIEMYFQGSAQEEKANAQMDDGEATRLLLNQKYNQLFGEK